MAAKSGKEKKRTARKPTSRRKNLLRKVLKEIQDNPEKYRKFHELLQAARTIEERYRLLRAFATSPKELRALLPSELRVALWCADETTSEMTLN